jgi:hypothetical protein
MTSSRNPPLFFLEYRSTCCSIKSLSLHSFLPRRPLALNFVVFKTSVNLVPALDVGLGRLVHAKELILCVMGIITALLATPTPIPASRLLPRFMSSLPRLRLLSSIPRLLSSIPRLLCHASVGTTVTATATLHSVVLEMAALVSDVTPVTAINASGTPFPPVRTPAAPRMHRGAMARED